MALGLGDAPYEWTGVAIQRIYAQAWAWGTVCNPPLGNHVIIFMGVHFAVNDRLRGRTAASIGGICCAKWWW